MAKRQWPWQPKFVTQSILPKSISKNIMSDKTKERKKKKGKKEFAIEYFEC